MATQTEIVNELNELLRRPNVHRNLFEGALVEHAIRRGEARLASNGALVAYTQPRTGRSPKDKFVVQDAATANKVAWGPKKVQMKPDAVHVGDVAGQGRQT